MTSVGVPNVDGPMVFRFKFTVEVMEAVTAFAKLHQFDDRHDYKKAWQEWCDENSVLIDGEVKRLESLGYTGDVLDKLFKSGRYYFRNKSTQKKPEVERRKYTGLSRDTLKAMDSYIEKNALTNGHSPADSFTCFCTKNVEILRSEITVLVSEHGFDDAEIQAKLKKTFKNRYYQVSRKN
jgi:hypothetical protein